MDTATIPPRTYHLGTALAAELDALIAARPGASATQIARAFERKTGRPVDRVSVNRRRRRRDRPSPPPGRPFLSGEHKALLLEVCRQAAPGYCRVEIAEEFAALSGRTIAPSTVSLFVRKHLGAPAVAPGAGGKLVRGRVESRIAEASARKLAGHKPDRSPRVARSGRYTA